jgi:lipopolysaccharide/colanic/teichoic acid biosynthesis glycosyltransferase
LVESNTVRNNKKSLQKSSNYIWWKGLFERPLAFIMLVFLSPLLIIIALVVKIDSPGNIIFCQQRVGKDGRIFIIYKFRSMYSDNDDSKYKAFLKKYVNNPVFSSLDENGQDIRDIIRERVTRSGYILRRFSLDELPQIVNIIKGEMTFIGPRPDLPDIVKMYKEYHLDRLNVKPGITGLWQVSGRRNLSFDDMVRLDIEYIKHQSLFLDAKILLGTVRELLVRKKADI